MKAITVGVVCVVCIIELWIQAVPSQTQKLVKREVHTVSYPGCDYLKCDKPTVNCDGIWLPKTLTEELQIATEVNATGCPTLCPPSSGLYCFEMWPPVNLHQEDRRRKRSSETYTYHAPGCPSRQCDIPPNIKCKGHWKALPGVAASHGCTDCPAAEEIFCDETELLINSESDRHKRFINYTGPEGPLFNSWPDWPINCTDAKISCVNLSLSMLECPLPGYELVLGKCIAEPVGCGVVCNAYQCRSEDGCIMPNIIPGTTGSHHYVFKSVEDWRVNETSLADVDGASDSG